MSGPGTISNRDTTQRRAFLTALEATSYMAGLEFRELRLFLELNPFFELNSVE